MQQLYVTFREERDKAELVSGEWVAPLKTPLGFAAVYDPESLKCEAKNRKQDEWASEYPWGGGIWIDGVLHSSKNIRQEDNSFTRISIPIEFKIKPRILNNGARDSFKIVDTVTRYSTSNKLWRILDPYGFELEISTANMEEIIMGGVIDRGEIIGQCIWDFGKNGIGKATLLRVP